MASEAQVALTPVVAELHRDPVLRSRGYVSDDSMYEMLGFRKSVRIDQSDYEGSDEQLDLNLRETPPSLCNAFDLILDSGTIEHVFDIGQAMKHCLQMTRPGGRIVHLTPSSNAINHGFYSVSPALYADFYTASGCVVEKLWLCRMPKSFERGPWQVYDCLRSDRNWLPLGRLDGSIWFTFAVIRKGNAAIPMTPQQSFYVSTWSQKEKPENAEKLPRSGLLSDEPSDTRAGRLLQATKKWPVLHTLAGGLITQWRRIINVNQERRRGRVPFPFVGTF
jgi:SAM-dependent methyltransferase